MIGLVILAAATATAIPSSPNLGKAEGQCRPNEAGPAFLVAVNGLKDRTGTLKVEVYPANDRDFLADDNVLVSAGRTFRRVEIAVPASGAVQLCVRVPSAGPYALTILHDRDSNRKFGLSTDGIGFGSNPKLGMSKPKAAAATVRAGGGPTRIGVTMNYRSGLFSFGPLRTN